MNTVGGKSLHYSFPLKIFLPFALSQVDFWFTLWFFLFARLQNTSIRIMDQTNTEDTVEKHKKLLASRSEQHKHTGAPQKMGLAH